MPDSFLTNLQQYPGWQGIQDDLSGVVGEDTKKQLSQFAAERGMRGGLGAGSPVTDTSLLRAFYDTSDRLKARGQSELSPLYQQQVSEGGQNARLTQTLTSQETIAKLQQAGMDSRQAADLQATMQRLQYSESAADKRQLADLQGAMQRLQAGNANQMDIAKLQQATQLSTTAANNLAAAQRQEASNASQATLQSQQLAAQQAMQQAALQQQASQAAAQNELGYAGLNTAIYRDQQAAGPSVSLAPPGGGSTSGGVSVGGAQPSYYSGLNFGSYGIGSPSYNYGTGGGTGDWTSSYPWGNYNTAANSFNTGISGTNANANTNNDEDYYNWGFTGGLSEDSYW